MNVKPPNVVLRNQVATWLTSADYAKLVALAMANHVTLSEYLRSIIVDAVADEAVIAAPCGHPPAERRA